MIKNLKIILDYELNIDYVTDNMKMLNKNNSHTGDFLQFIF